MRCDRISTSTGKPSNSIVSQRSDLARHEDTVHNGRKLKVRCHLCTEYQTVSRNNGALPLLRHAKLVWTAVSRRYNQVDDLTGNPGRREKPAGGKTNRTGTDGAEVKAVFAWRLPVWGAMFDASGYCVTANVAILVYS
jgi:hypothetical protein